jgi:hypothetical protein
MLAFVRVYVDCQHHEQRVLPVQQDCEILVLSLALSIRLIPHADDVHALRNRKEPEPEP